MVTPRSVAASSQKHLVHFRITTQPTIPLPRRRHMTLLLMKCQRLPPCSESNTAYATDIGSSENALPLPASVLKTHTDIRNKIKILQLTSIMHKRYHNAAILRNKHCTVVCFAHILHVKPLHKQTVIQFLTQMQILKTNMMFIIYL